MIIWGDIPRNCPVCGRFLKKTVEEEDRTVWACSNTTVDHAQDWDVAI